MNCDVPYEELAAYAADDLAPARSAEIRGHLQTCAACRERLADLRKVDAALAAARPAEPPPDVLLETRRALTRALAAPPTPEVLTLDEVAAFLRIDGEQLAEIVEELPAFELGGQVRVRRRRLIEWIERRERDYARQAAASWAARAAAGAEWKGVA